MQGKIRTRARIACGIGGGAHQALLPNGSGQEYWGLTYVLAYPLNKDFDEFLELHFPVITRHDPLHELIE